MSLPSDFTEEFYPIAEGVLIMGKPLNSLSKKELSATVVYLIKENEAKQEVLNSLTTYQEPKRYSRDT